jgi:Ras family
MQTGCGCGLWMLEEATRVPDIRNSRLNKTRLDERHFLKFHLTGPLRFSQLDRRHLLDKEDGLYLDVGGKRTWLLLAKALYSTPLQLRQLHSVNWQSNWHHPNCKMKDPAIVSRKIAVLGFRGVGKTSLTNSFVTGKFSDVYDPTIEGTHHKAIRFRKVHFATDIVDTAGMVRRYNNSNDVTMKTKSGAALVGGPLVDTCGKLSPRVSLTWIVFFMRIPRTTG